jgi:hypothetical protein
MSTEENDNVVPDKGVVGFGGPSLDPDPTDDSFLDEFDKLDDKLDAEAAKEEAPAEPAPVENPTEDENFLNDGLNEPTPEHTNDTAATPTEATDPATQVQPEQPIQDTTEIDPEIAAIQEPRNVSEESKENWKKMREIASRYKKEASEAEVLRQRLAQFEQQPPVQTPADYEELKKFKQIFDLKNDPDFHSKYETPINSATESIYSILKKNGASDETINSIQQAGGPNKVSETWWKQNVIDKLPLTDAERLKRNLVDVVDLHEKRDQEIAQTAQQAEQILEQRKTEKLRWYQNETTEINKEVEEITKEAPWARYREVPQEATPEQIQEIQKHNASVSDLAEKFQHALWPKSAGERTRVAAAAVLSHKLVEQLKLEQQMRSGLQAQLKKIETENSQLKMAGRAPKASANVTSSKVNPGTNDRWRMNAGDAIDMGLDEAGA